MHINSIVDGLRPLQLAAIRRFPLPASGHGVAPGTLVSLREKGLADYHQLEGSKQWFLTIIGTAVRNAKFPATYEVKPCAHYKTIEYTSDKTVCIYCGAKFALVV